ncbi:hypothetical protein [Paraburkholderia fungorum]|uniref:hypothetical protein n=1 Tax=Paraburkholderia fungorum TaxID=134537 RepID=UPI00160238C8|nr:hypothetical protein [Paraburkholderia fungorum]
MQIPDSAVYSNEWFSRQIPGSIITTTWVNQIAKKRRKMLEIGHLDSFPNI